MCNSVAYIITTKYFWVPGKKKKRKKTNKCVWLLSIDCGFLFYSADLIGLFAESLDFVSSSLALSDPHTEAPQKSASELGLRGVCPAL